MFKQLGKFLFGFKVTQFQLGYPDVATFLRQGDKFFAEGDLEHAEQSYQQAILADPGNASAFTKLGRTLDDQGKFLEAITCCKKAIQLNSDNAEAHYYLGLALNDSGCPEKAIPSFERAISLRPAFAEAFNNMGNSFNIQHQLDKAIDCYQKALELKPNYVGALNNLIFLLDMSVTADTKALQDLRRRWYNIDAKSLQQFSDHPNSIDPDRKLRIGYVSADFREHSAANVFGMMLVKFDNTKFDVIAYSNTVIHDGLTNFFRQHATTWRNIVGMSDERVAELIRQDSVDILLDLSGYSTGNRLLVFARKPAPIQITAWGYALSTGLPTMDVFFADPVLIPQQEQHFYTEHIRYLPSFVGYFRPQEFPPVSKLPALSEKSITFGSFNRLAKISDNAIRVWGQVLSSVPNSRLVLKTPELVGTNTRIRVLDDFARGGIVQERITLLGRTSWLEHMTAFNLIDISLDPFPHGGGVTTMEGLMMGVPVVTLRWPTIAGKLSASILTTLELTDWIAETPEQYVAIAAQKAKDLENLARLRTQLRPRFMSSIIGDADAYVRAVEQEYRKLWREWCERKNAASQPFPE